MTSRLLGIFAAFAFLVAMVCAVIASPNHANAVMVDYTFTVDMFDGSGDYGMYEVGDEIYGVADVTGDPFGVDYVYFDTNEDVLMVETPTVSGIDFAEFQNYAEYQQGYYVRHITDAEGVQHAELEWSLASGATELIGFCIGGPTGVACGTAAPSMAVNPVPVPAALPLFAGGLAAMGLVARRRKSS